MVKRASCAFKRGAGSCVRKRAGSAFYQTWGVCGETRFYIFKIPPLPLAMAFCYNCGVRSRGGKSAAMPGMIFTILLGAERPGTGGTRKRSLPPGAARRPVSPKAEPSKGVRQHPPMCVAVRTIQ